MDHKYYAKVEVKGKNIPEPLLSQMKNNFWRQYSKLIAETNPMYEKVNDKWEKLHGEDFNNLAYEHYIATWQDRYCKKFNLRYPFRLVDLHGISNNGELEVWGTGRWPFDKTEFHWYIWEEV